jgi:hypothetical protein
MVVVSGRVGTLRTRVADVRQTLVGQDGKLDQILGPLCEASSQHDPFASPFTGGQAIASRS